MAIVEIINWLTGTKEYLAGTTLYDTYGSDAFLKRLFKKGESSFNVEKLEGELRKISDAAPDAPPASPRFEIPSRKEFEALPDAVKKLKEEKDLLFKEMSYLHSGLEEMELPDRGRAAFRIIDLAKALAKIWDKLDYYAEHKKLPEEQPVITVELTPGKALNRRNTLRTYISRNPDSMKAGSWRAELEAVEKICNA